jgi:phosphohistidine phosphatase
VKELYVMRHGEAAAGADDAVRPLSDVGLASAQSVAALARRGGVRVDMMVHSGLVRARQTADVLANSVAYDSDPDSRPDMRAEDPIEPTLEWLLAAPDSQTICLVGHVPFLDRLIGALTTGSESNLPVGLAPAGLAKLARPADKDDFVISWVVTPQIAAGASAS